MTEAYIYDAVRTPRGRGKKDGALHEITALSLATQVLQALRDRNELDTSKVDDVVLGCVAPVGEQGSDIARTAVLTADYAQTHRRRTDQPLLRLRARGLQHGRRQGDDRRGRHGHRRRRGEHEPRAHGQRQRRLAARPLLAPSRPISRRRASGPT